MDVLGTCNLEAYLRKMAIDGHIVTVDISEARELVRLLRISSNNLNQIAKRLNEGRGVYQVDINELQEDYNKLWKVAEELLDTLSKI